MENKEVEDCILDITQGTHSLKHYPKNLRVITNYIEQLEKENAELKKHKGADDTADAMIYASMVEQKHKVAELEKQLQAKDKALEKACGKIVKDNCSEDNAYYEQCLKNWKEHFENGID